ncbi:hypothetical protein [Blastococcus brunescens]|uniref:Uncharacterized protein n=1 Tax=Blastococcus brunescens TaxID=1564165 RepID=A0ABZ1ATI1_9ACTN|nr:hypothetical protein [Blastococcus sp. BMG 8361]WRL61820.1 hypothetical protein U6N30_17000 [Blastococcus sp. BMG 8361]
MSSHRAGELLLAETAASAGTTSERGQALLEVLRRVVPFDGAWLALADPLGHGYSSLASVDLDDPTVEFLAGPLTAHDIEAAGADRGPPMSRSDLPPPARRTRRGPSAWSRPASRRRWPSRCSLPEAVPSASWGCCPRAGSHRPRPCAAGSGGSHRCSRTASTRCGRWSPPRAWFGAPRPAWCCAPTATVRRCRACRRMRCWSPTPRRGRRT